jgi:hypothetical protein
VAVGDYQVAILFGDGAGNFGPPALFSTATPRPGRANASTLAVGDLNGDGHLDVVSAGQATSSLSVLLGDGTGQLGAPRQFTQFNPPRAIALADFDEDGHLDIAVTNGGPGVTILRGDVNGNFAFSAAVPVARAGAVAVGDFDGDGHTDLVAIGSEALLSPPATVAVALGDGTGRFGPPSFHLFGPADTATIDREATQLAVADFDGDGNLDVAIPNPGGNEVALLPGNGDGTFGDAETFATDGLAPVGIAAGDFTGSGTPDLAVANHTSDTVGILLNGSEAGRDAAARAAVRGRELA